MSEPYEIQAFWIEEWRWTAKTPEQALMKATDLLARHPNANVYLNGQPFTEAYEPAPIVPVSPSPLS